MAEWQYYEVVIKKKQAWDRWEKPIATETIWKQSGMGACASTPKDEKSLRAVRYGSLSRPRERVRVRELPQHSIFKGSDPQGFQDQWDTLGNGDGN